MTIWFKEDWNAYEAGDIVNLPAAVEAELVAAGKAIDQAKVMQFSKAANDGAVMGVADGVTFELPGHTAPLMGIVGDSRFAGSYNSTNNPHTTIQVGFVGLALALSGKCVRVTDDGWQAVGGQRVTTGTATTDLAPFSVQVTNILAAGIRNVTMLGCTNDFSSSIGTVQTVDQVVAAYKTEVLRLLNAGCRVWLCTDPGVRATEAASGATKTQHVSVLRTNEWIRELAHYYPNRVKVVDLAGVMVEAASSTASPPTSWHQDANHYNLIGNYWGAKEIARVWNLDFAPAPILPRTNSDNFSYDATLANKLDNGLFLTDTNADGLADSWTYSAATGITVVNSLVAGSVVGNAQRCVFTASQSGYPKMQSSDLVARIPTGSWMVFVCRALVTSPVACTAPRAKIVENGAGTDAVDLEFGNAATLPENATFVLSTPPIQKAADMTLIKAEVALRFTGAGAATLDIEQAAVFVLPQF